MNIIYYLNFIFNDKLTRQLAIREREIALEERELKLEKEKLELAKLRKELEHQ